MNRASDWARVSMMLKPAWNSPAATAGACGSPAAPGGSGARSSSERSEPAMLWIGASELLISCESTRISRSHAARSSSRNARERSESNTSSCGRPSWM